MVRILAQRKIASGSIDMYFENGNQGSSPNCTIKKLVKDEIGIAKNIIVAIYPPFCIPKILTHAAGKHEKWPPSHKNDSATHKV